MTAERAQTTFHVTERYRQYVVWLLCAVYLFNHVDRQILAILIQPIKAEFNLSDAQLGLVGGLAFALFYSTLGIPIARLADRSSRTNIIAASLALWSLFTALTGLARNFYHLLLARVIVGVGEAGCSPPAYSLIGDYFEPKRRATAIAIYSLGVSGGAIVGLLIGSAVAEAHGWRTAFFVLGVPGIVLAVIVKLTLREPPRGWADGTPAPARIAPVGEVFRALWAKQTFRAISIAAALHAFVACGVAGFYSAFLIRSHDMGLAQTGRWLAFASIVGGLAGTFFGGRLTERPHRSSQRWSLGAVDTDTDADDQSAHRHRAVLDATCRCRDRAADRQHRTGQRLSGADRCEHPAARQQRTSGHSPLPSCCSS